MGKGHKISSTTQLVGEDQVSALGKLGEMAEEIHLPLEGVPQG